MNKAYSRINWENEPSAKTPINEDNLNRMDVALNEIDNRVIAHETTKLNVAVANGLVKDVTFNESDGVFIITKLNGSKITINTNLEKLAVNFKYDSKTQQLVINLDDGTKQYIDLSALITQLEFLDSATISFTIATNGKVSASIKNGSIKGEMLDPNYLAQIQVEVANAQQSASNAKNSADLSKSYAVGTDNIVRESDSTDNSKYYSESAKSLHRESVTLLEETRKTLEETNQKVIETTFSVNIETGELEYTSPTYIFNVSDDGMLHWEVA